MNTYQDRLWDFFCAASLAGIWPRYIEPKLLATTKIDIALPQLPKSLEGLRILQFSDLHLHDNVSNSFLSKLQKKINETSPDIIVFTGDFICYSILSNRSRLKTFLKGLHAPLGCYCIFGNHDYEEGHYDALETTKPIIKRAFQRIFSKVPNQKEQNVKTHSELIDCLHQTPFHILDNASKTISVGHSALNLCGLGEYTLGRCLPKQAFKNYDERFPGIILSHNPDSIPLLNDFPGEIILCGHTHGAQVNLPWLWKRFTLLENAKYKRGLIQENNKWIYVNRGVGSIIPFRLFSIPEILLLTLRGKK